MIPSQPFTLRGGTLLPGFPAQVQGRVQLRQTGGFLLQLGFKAGVDMSRDFYSHIECGDYNIRVSELSALRKIFQCSYDDIFRGF